MRVRILLSHNEGPLRKVVKIRENVELELNKTLERMGKSILALKSKRDSLFQSFSFTDVHVSLVS